jgi:hypothetical protein
LPEVVNPAQAMAKDEHVKPTGPHGGAREGAGRPVRRDDEEEDDRDWMNWPAICEPGKAARKWISFKVKLSGYPNELYDSTLAGWNRHDFELPNDAAGGSAKARLTESVWCNF